MLFAVSYYELIYAEDAAELFSLNGHEDSRLPETQKRFHITEEDVVAGSIEPLEAGSAQSATFELRNVTRKRSYYLALRSVDKANKTSKISNVAIFFVPQSLAQEIVVHDTNNAVIGRNVTAVNLPKMSAVAAILTGLSLALIVYLSVSLLLAVTRQSTNNHLYKAVRIQLVSNNV